MDVVGLYLNPPEHAVVLCCDEKCQIQALDRTQPGLPIKKGRCGTMTHDYKRNGTTTLFAALSMLDGKVIADCMPRHRHWEWIKFLKGIEEQTPAGLNLHLMFAAFPPLQAITRDSRLSLPAAVLFRSTLGLPQLSNPSRPQQCRPGGLRFVRCL